MAREGVTIVICDGCGTASLSGAEFQRLTLSAPGKMQIVYAKEICQDCANALDVWLQARLIAHGGTRHSVTVDL